MPKVGILLFMENFFINVLQFSTILGLEKSKLDVETVSVFDIHVCLRVKYTCPLKSLCEMSQENRVESEGSPDGERNDKVFTTFFTDFKRYQNGYFNVSI